MAKIDFLLMAESINKPSLYQMMEVFALVLRVTDEPIQKSKEPAALMTGAVGVGLTVTV